MFDFAQYTLNKILLGAGAFVGVSIANVLWPAPYVKHKGVVVAAMTVTAMAVALSITAGGALLIWAGVDQSKADIVLFWGVVFGILFPFASNALKNFFVKREKMDIAEVAVDVKDSITGAKK
jgi:hypothetical protein